MTLAIKARWRVRWGCLREAVWRITPTGRLIAASKRDPGLEFGETSHRRFQVLPPDPHRFDSDRDGVGCES